MSSRKGKSTRRNKAYKKHLTIPEIKNSFDTVSRGTYDIIKEGGSSAEQVKKFQKLWKSIFHRPVSADAAEAYLKMKRISKESRPYTRKSKKQKGGAALSGAPLDYTVRPGVDTPGYGNFPEYQVAGLKAYDSYNLDGLTQGCGKVDITPDLYGSAQKGGNLNDYFGTPLSQSGQTAPPSRISDSVAALDGTLKSSAPAPYINPRISH